VTDFSDPTMMHSPLGRITWARLYAEAAELSNSTSTGARTAPFISVYLVIFLSFADLHLDS